MSDEETKLEGPDLTGDVPLSSIAEGSDAARVCAR